MEDNFAFSNKGLATAEISKVFKKGPRTIRLRWNKFWFKKEEGYWITELWEENGSTFEPGHIFWIRRYG
jgi:hypothetical protein